MEKLTKEQRENIRFGLKWSDGDKLYRVKHVRGEAWHLTTEEFKARIKAIVGLPETIEGAKPSNPALVRTPSDKGYYPPCKE